MSKGKFLLGKCDNADIAEEQKQRLLQLGIQESNICIHPDNVLEDEDKEEAVKKFGLKLLGVWLGSDEYVSANLRKKLDTLREEAEKLKTFSNLQTMYLLLSNCYCQKVNYLMRTTPNRLMEPFLRDYEGLKMGVFAKLLGNEHPDGILPSDLKMQAQARSLDGGFSLGNTSKTTHAAYVASVIGTLDAVRDHFHGYNPEQQRDFLDSVAEIQTWTPAGEEQEVLDVAELRATVEVRMLGSG
jgi:hypothetical protein